MHESLVSYTDAKYTFLCYIPKEPMCHVLLRIFQVSIPYYIISLSFVHVFHVVFFHSLVA